MVLVSQTTFFFFTFRNRRRYRKSRTMQRPKPDVHPNIVTPRRSQKPTDHRVNGATPEAERRTNLNEKRKGSKEKKIQEAGPAVAKGARTAGRKHNSDREN